MLYLVIRYVIIWCILTAHLIKGQSVTTVNFGTLHGSTTRTTWSGRPIYQFLGVRYAESPSGSRRFKEPKLAIPWLGEHYVQSHGIPCPNLKYIQNLTQHQMDSDLEDCLHLSIYSANLSGRNPVMVYIHGGAFETGSSNQRPPNYLLEKDIVLVVPQYRLGPLGFLSTETNEISGNAAVLDVILALKWIKNYIIHFGGDPSNLTLFGQSAGAALISALIFSPSVSLDLFQKVILQSGSSFGSWVYDFNPVQNAVDIAGRAGCDTNATIYDINKCFMNLTVTDLLKAYHSHSEIARIKGMDQYGGSKLTINHILPVRPMDTVKYNNCPKNISIMAGVTKHDGTFILTMIYEYLMKNVDLNVRSFNKYHLLPIIIDFLGIKDYTGTLTGYLINKFFTPKQISKGNFTEMKEALIDIVSVVTMKAPILTLLQMHAQQYPEQSYLYSFDYEGQYSIYKHYLQNPNYPFYRGVHHSDDNLYLFPQFDYAPQLNEDDTKVVQTMIELWTSFAKHGIPQSECIGTWSPLTDFSGPYLHINQKCTIGEDFLDEYSVTSNEAGTLQSEQSFALARENKSHLIIFGFIVVLFLIWST